VVLLALVLIAVGLFTNEGKRREFTTSSQEAYDLFRQGNRELNSFQLDRAEKTLGKAVELDPDFAMAHASLALLYSLFSSPESRQNLALELALADSLADLLADEQEKLLVKLRLSNLGLADSQAQDSMLTRAEEICPDHRIVLITKANRAGRRGDVNLQEKMWREVLRLDPNYALAYNLLGYLAAGRGSYDEAVTLLQKYVFLAPDLANPHDSLGEILTRVGRYEEAEAEFLRALEIQPDFYVSLVNLGRVYIEQGQVNKGLEILSETRAQLAGTEIEPLVERTLFGIFLTNWLPEELSRTARRYAARFPDDRNSAIYRVFSLTLAGEVATAENLADSVIAVFKAEPVYEANAVARRRIDSGAHRFGALFALARGDLELAATEWEAALKTAGDLPSHDLNTFRVPYAWTLAQLGRWQEALPIVHAVLAVNPRNLGALAIQAQALLASDIGEKGRRALASLEAALAGADADFPALATAESLRAVCLSHDRP